MASTRLVIGLFAGLGLLGCNMLTGADQLVVDDETTPDDGTAGSPSTEDGNGGSGAGTVSTGAGTQVGGSTGEGAGGPVEATTDATGYNVREVAFYQAVKSTVFANGAAQNPSVRLVANRPAVVRVFVDTSSTSGAPVTARLTLGNNPPLEVAAAGSYSSTDDEYGSTINFDVPASYMQAGGTWQVQLVESTDTASGANPSASTPATNLAVEASHSLKVTIVPVMYQADGSNRMPDTSQTQLDRYQAYFMTLYPATSVEVSVGPTLNWNQGIDASGNGWDALLNQLSQVRSGAAVAFDDYYYGAFEPAASFEQFCGGGCVAGLGFIGDPGGEYSRAAIGLGYGGDVAAWTAVHEVGHNHGRPHSPCGGVSGADPGYPHTGGSIGVWGMDIFGHQMVSPSFKDFMGYCEPTWISDYVYENILSFMQDTGGSQSFYIPEAELDQTYERISVGGADPSAATFLSPLKMTRPPTGTLQTVTVTREDGTHATVEGHYYAYDHLPGGVLFVKQQAKMIRSLDTNLDVGGIMRNVRAAR